MPRRSSCMSRRPRCRGASAILTGAAKARAHAEDARELQVLALAEKRDQEKKSSADRRVSGRTYGEAGICLACRVPPLARRSSCRAG